MRDKAHLPVHTATELYSSPLLLLLLSRWFTSTETVRLIRDGGRIG